MDKKIYSYQVGENKRFADPLEVIRKLWIGLDGQFNSVLKETQSDNPSTSCLAQEKLMPVVRDVFELPCIDPTTGNGITDRECIAILKDFITFMDVKKKSQDSKLTFVPPME